MRYLAKIVSVSLIFVSTNFSFFDFQIFRYRWFQSIRSSWYIFTKLSHSGRRWRCGLAETWILRSQRPYPGKDPWFRTRSILCSLCRKWPVRIRLAQELVRQKAVSKIRRKFQSRTFGTFTIEKTRSRTHQDSFEWLVLIKRAFCGETFVKTKSFSQENVSLDFKWTGSLAPTGVLTPEWREIYIICYFLHIIVARQNACGYLTLIWKLDKSDLIDELNQF